MEQDQPRTALVHDFLLDVRGAERVFLALCELFPDADLFTAVYDAEGTRGCFEHRSVTASYLQRLRPSARTFRTLLPLYPAAMERLDLSGYDLVISSSSAWAHGVSVPDAAAHVCYCHNPFRYAWDEREATLAARDPLTRLALGKIFDRWRDWDRRVARGVDRYVANSVTTQERIARSFDRVADVVYPPVDLDRFGPGPVGDYHLVLSELMSHKRLDVAVRAFNRLGRRLVVVGDGPDSRRLHSIAGPTVTFTGRATDAEVASLLAGAQALVVTGTEEFGIAAVEAQAAGRPVIANRAGGLLETVVDGVTGTFFEPSDPEALATVVAGFDAGGIDADACVANARRFGREQFAEGILRAVGMTRPSGFPVLAEALR